MNLSIYIPHVFLNISKEYIINIFDILEIGKIKYIDIVPKVNNNNKYYNSAYIYFEEWYDNIVAKNFQERILNADKEARIVYDDPYFWVILENKTTKSLQRKPRICLDDLSQTNFEKSLVSISSDEIMHNKCISNPLFHESDDYYGVV